MDAKTFNRYMSELKSSEKAFRCIYEYYLPKIKYRVNSRYRGAVDFEDVAHELFTRLFRMEKVPEVKNPTAWIYTICDNLCNDEIRRRHGTLSLDENVATKKQAPQTEGDLGFFELLAHLPSEDAEIVRLCVWDGYNLKEIANMLGIKHGAVRQKYSRALKKLKKFV